MRQPSGRRRLTVALVATTFATTVTSILTAGAAIAAPAEGSVRGAGAAGAIPDRYIVVLKDGSAAPATAAASAPAAAAASLVNRYGGSVRHTYDSAIRGFSVQASAADARRLAADPAVAYVEQDGVATVTATQADPPWGLDRIDQSGLPLNDAYTYTVSAYQVYAYILDTGVLTTHLDFGGRVGWGLNTTGDGKDYDCHGHGTHVAGTVGGSTFGVAKAIRMIAVKVLGCDGSGSWAGIIEGVDWVTRHAAGRIAVANMSLGGGRSDALNDAVTASIASGITYTVAAGNSGADACNVSPASTPGAITVGATTSADTRSSFSNWGSCLDIFAPGSTILSTWIGADNAAAYLSGTSMAAPHVAGAAALVLARHPTYSPTQVWREVVYNAGYNKVANAGTGSPNRLLYTGMYGWYGNSTDVNIPDAGGTIYSSRSITGLYAYASPDSQVYVNVVHPRRGDIRIYLIAPDGTQYLLKWSSSGDTAANVVAIYPVNLSTELRNGTWRLKVQDVAAGSTGYLNAWSVMI